MKAPFLLRPLAMVAGAVILASGCAVDRSAGNSSETENTVSALDLRIDSLLPFWNHPMDVPTVATLRLDRRNFDFGRTDGTGSGIGVQRPDGTPVPFQTIYWDKAAELARLRVRLDPDLLAADARMKLVWNLAPAVRSDSAAVWKGIPDSQRIAIGSVKVDDFERGTMENLLPVPQVWYSGLSDSARVNWFMLASAGAGRAGKAIAIGYAADSAKGQYAVIGCSMGPGLRNFRSLDSLVFWTRGSGMLHASLDHFTPGKGDKARFTVGLDSVWRRIRIRPSDFEPPDGIGGNVGWSVVRDSISNLTFLVSGGKELWIDDVRLYGIERDDLR